MSFSPVRGEVDPPPAKKRTFVQNVKNIQHALKNLYIKTFFCIVTPSLSTGSNEIFNIDLKSLSPKWAEVGICPLKDEYFFDALP